MNERFFRIAHLSRRLTGGLVGVSAAALLVTGAAWQGIAADAETPAAYAATAEPSQIAPAAIAGRDSYADVVKRAAPAVVTVRTEGKAKVSPTGFEGDEDLLRRFFGDRFEGAPRGRQPRQSGLGSGVIVTRDGYILTNHHVIDGAEKIRIEMTDGRSFAAKLVGSDPPTDLALLKAEAPDLQAIAIGNSDAVQVGDLVLAVGNPLGIGQTVTMGIVSAKGRSTGVGDGSYEDFLQTDAPINRGNSGGALVNMKGELVGINSQILSTSGGNIGIGFAIPANMARSVMDDLRNTGKVRRSQLGVTVQVVTSEMAESLGLKTVGGAIVSSVTPDSAADRAGVQRNDVIKSINGQAVQDTNTLRNRVAEADPGSTASLVVVRDGSERTLTVKFDEAPAGKSARSEPDADDRSALGITVAPAPKGKQGVLVESVQPDGRAAEAGLEPGDVIEEVNRKRVETIDDLRAAVRNGSDRPVLLLISREGRELFLTVG
jgi:serine protease Do